MPSPNRTCPVVAWVLLVLIGLGGAAGCHSWRPPAADFGDPAWKVVAGQAVWHPGRGRGDTEIAGEFLLGSAADGRGYVQFSKPPIVLAEARCDATHWLAGFPAMNRTFSGPGKPSHRLAWNQVLEAALGRPPGRGWILTGSMESRWRIARPESGEWIEGTRLP